MIKIIQPAHIETEVRGDIMAVKVPKALMVMSDEDWFFFIDMKNTKKKSLDLEALRTYKGLRHYFYLDGGNINDLALDLARGKDTFYDKLALHAGKNSLKIVAQKDFNPSKLMWFSGDDHLFYSFRSNMPITKPYYVHYISGVCNDHYDLDKAEDILKKHKWVSEVERIKIPYYNADTHTHAVEFVVKLPQKTYGQLVRYYRDEKKEEFWSCRLKDCLSSPYSLEPFDILGLKAALTEETLKNMEKWKNK
jgi:hypothetical protein